MNQIEELLDAERAMREADEAFVAATKKAFPVGSRVVYRYRRNGDEHSLFGEVTSHGGIGHYAGYIIIKNERTGKGRGIQAAYAIRCGDLEAIPTPPQEPQK